MNAKGHQKIIRWTNKNLHQYFSFGFKKIIISSLICDSIYPLSRIISSLDSHKINSKNKHVIAPTHRLIGQ